MDSIQQAISTNNIFSITIDDRPYSLELIPYHQAKSSIQKSDIIFLPCFQAEHLYRDAMKIPELAWDLIEFAEKPMALKLENYKETSPAGLVHDSYILFLLHKPYQQLHHYVLVVRKAVSNDLPTPTNVINLQFEKLAHLVPYRKINLQMNGEIKMQDVTKGNEFS